METCKDEKLGHTWEIYQDRENEWRWRRISRNGRIIGASTQGYINKAECIANARLPGMVCTPKQI